MKQKVTIGMPVYNGGIVLMDALKSLTEQSFTDFIVVVSDNASPMPETGRISGFVSAKDSRVRYVRHAQNIGAAANFRSVLALAETEYFMWAAHDDVWAEGFLSETVAALDGDPRVDFAMTDYLTVSRGLGPFRLHHPRHNMRCIELEDGVSRVLAYAKMKAVTHKDNMIYSLWRTDVLKSIIATWADFPFGRDTIGGPMCEMALANHKGKFIDKVLFYKQYQGLAPGHPLEKPYRNIMGLKARLRGVHTEPGPYRRDDRIEQLTISLRGAGLPEAAISAAAQVHE